MEYLKSARTDILFLYVAVAIFFLMTISNYSSLNHVVIVSAAMLTSMYMLFVWSEPDFKKWEDVHANIENDATDTTDPLPTETIFDAYQVHKTPEVFKYIVKHDDSLTFINKIRFVKRYDIATYQRILILLEAFFKTYDATLANKIDCTRSISIMQDIRREALNEVTRAQLSIPQRFDAILQDALGDLQALTYTCVKVASKRCEKRTRVKLMVHRPPYPSSLETAKHDLF